MQPPGTHHDWQRIPLLTALAIGIGLLSAAGALAQAPQPKMGEVLPIPAPKQAPITDMDWRQVPPPQRFVVKPPPGAPNVVIVLMDQAGYADPATMGGADSHADDGPAGPGRPDLHQLPRQCAVLAQPRGAPDRAQQPPEQHGRRGGDQHRLPRRYRENTRDQHVSTGGFPQ